MDERKLERKNVVCPVEQLTWASDVLLLGDHQKSHLGGNTVITITIRRDEE